MNAAKVEDIGRTCRAYVGNDGEKERQHFAEAKSK
jgi:hypothetical protein